MIAKRQAIKKSSWSGDYRNHFNLGDEVSFPPNKTIYIVTAVEPLEMVCENTWGTVRIFDVADNSMHFVQEGGERRNGNPH